MPRPAFRPAALVLSAVAAGACASAPSGARPVADPSANTGTQTTSIVNGVGTYSISATNTGPGTSERAIAVSPDSAFQALQPAYESLGLTPNTVVSAQRTVGVRDGQFRRALRKRRMSEFLECGAGALGVSNADDYAVRMTVMSRVLPAPAGAGSVVSTQLVATAQSTSQSGDPVQCASTGRLEQAINNLVAVQSAR